MDRGSLALTSLVLVGISLALAQRAEAAPAKRDSATRAAAKAEAFRTITKSNNGVTSLAEAVPTDAEIVAITGTTSPENTTEDAARAPAAAIPTATVETKPLVAPSTPEPSRKPAQAIEMDSDEAAAAAKPKAVATETPGIDPEQSLRWLKNGNLRYVKKNYRADGKAPADRARVSSSAQRPHAIVLSCSDSRVPPETVFDQSLGEIFVVRNLGEGLDSAAVASIEYALENLGARLIVVLGHTKCDAIDTALSAKEGESAGSPDLDKLLEGLRPRLKTVLSDARSKDLEIESALNADAAGRELLKRSAIVRARVGDGRLKIRTALYRMDSGSVSFY